jgi:hypothetical protein
LSADQTEHHDPNGEHGTHVLRGRLRSMAPGRGAMEAGAGSSSISSDALGGENDGAGCGGGRVGFSAAHCAYCRRFSVRIKNDNPRMPATANTATFSSTMKP